MRPLLLFTRPLLLSSAVISLLLFTRLYGLLTVEVIKDHIDHTPLTKKRVGRTEVEVFGEGLGNVSSVLSFNLITLFNFSVFSNRNTTIRTFFLYSYHCLNYFSY